MSVKGVVLNGNRVVLLRNGRDEWELPGGRLEPGEGPEECVAREILEELNVRVRVGPLLDAWVYEPLPGRSVAVLAYGCFAGGVEGVAHGGEHTAVGWFETTGLGEVELPEGYARAIRAWANRPG